MCDKEDMYVDLLKRELTPAIGCTEPIAIALACARAREVLDDPKLPVQSIELTLSGNVIKNAMGVGIPGTQMVGIPIAAALGAAGGDASKELEVLASVTEEHIAEAKALTLAKGVTVTAATGTDKLYVRSRITNTAGDTSMVTIERSHRNVTEVTHRDEVLVHRELEDLSVPAAADETRIAEIYEFATTCDIERISFLLEGANMNRRIAEEGLLKDYGLRVGRTIKHNIERRILAEDMENFAVQLAAAAADARMAGCMMPVMTNSGSGNQGITVFLPVAAVAERLEVTTDVLVRALALSNLVAIHIKKDMGKLSALCGATTAAIGAGCGIVWLLGGPIQAVYAVINNMIGDLAGMICDGAKYSCSLKVATSVESAFRSALLALDKLEVSGLEGIIEDDIEKSIQNLVTISTRGMEETDRLILDIMVAKS
ncbi:MAG: L-serine ammonia-lyase, iron-sulfur-dependent, subunit alpha [Spirochaetia bacterium]|nr:L-serine ammonia-lyase, iron-sulfur-dependent, subunit alpha [Spirochaetia bacterium]